MAMKISRTQVNHGPTQSHKRDLLRDHENHKEAQVLGRNAGNASDDRCHLRPCGRFQ